MSEGLRYIPPEPDRPPVDRARIQRAVREILLAIGEDPERDGLVRTPQRVADMFAEVFAGLQEDP
ncbi:MAG TPA: GTP cyclohydrolase I, partial [Acidimicrobiia bacterium]|nr:GTP cyclohydrolase I [Acidimicrobiia bacterium]